MTARGSDSTTCYRAQLALSPAHAKQVDAIRHYPDTHPGRRWIGVEYCSRCGLSRRVSPRALNASECEQAALAVSTAAAPCAGGHDAPSQLALLNV